MFNLHHCHSLTLCFHQKPHHSVQFHDRMRWYRRQLASSTGIHWQESMALGITEEIKCCHIYFQKVGIVVRITGILIATYGWVIICLMEAQLWTVFYLTFENICVFHEAAILALHLFGSSSECIHCCSILLFKMFTPFYIILSCVYRIFHLIFQLVSFVIRASLIDGVRNSWWHLTKQWHITEMKMTLRISFHCKCSNSYSF